MKGIILAGGSGSRLYPITRSCSKQLLPVYDKPMIYYALSTLMIAGIWEIVIIVNPHDIDKFSALLGDGSQLGMNIIYRIQEKPNGIPEALKIGKEAFATDPDGYCLILGDNLFYGNELKLMLHESINKISKGISGACIYGYHVPNPQDFGVVEIKDDQIISIEEKPQQPKSNYAIPGLYFFNNNASKFSDLCIPSERGETEIIDVLKQYHSLELLDFTIMKRGMTWTDMGTVDSLLLANQLIHSVQKIHGYQIACIEEIAYRNEWITRHELLKISNVYSKTYYGNYLRRIADERV